MATPYSPGTLETDPKKQNMALQQHAKSIKSNTADIATNTANIATNTASIATNTANIATNTANIATLQTTAANLASPVVNSLAADVTLTDANYHDGPSCAQGTSGKWYAEGTVSVADFTAAATFFVKIWDGTTVAASCGITSGGAGLYATTSISGYFSNPAGNIRISVKDTNGSPNGKIIANATGLGKDSTLTAIRIG